jgi:hypothetical protein
MESMNGGLDHIGQKLLRAAWAHRSRVLIERADQTLAAAGGAAIRLR